MSQLASLCPLLATKLSLDGTSKQGDKLPVLLLDERGRAPSLIRMKAKAYENKLVYCNSRGCLRAAIWFHMNFKNPAFWDNTEKGIQ